MTTAFIFPGQGSQFVGMGKDLYETYPEAHAVFDAADAAFGRSLTAMMFGAGGDPDAEAAALTQTDVTQPALFVHSMAALAVLEARGLSPDMTAGHSLGEYSALCAAEAISLEDGLAIVRLRGQLMAEAGELRHGTMAAVLGLEDAQVEQVCEQATADGEGVVQAANYNSPGQIVISGDTDAIQRAMQRASEAGAKRVVPLTVSGAFHSPLMEHARTGLAAALEKLTIKPPRCPVYLNVTAQASTDPDEIRRRLLEQLTAPVRWAQMLQKMQADGAQRFIEVGTGNVLTGLVRRALGRQIEAATAGTSADIEKLTAASHGL